ncbi:hypothetical protein ABEW34_14530 [Paenibacillus algorifonticola]|uniref:hypothetical protein n=1 Tax=Paenibacillus algorifonticola TaxID=684063 RepID=UPI003D29E970
MVPTPPTSAITIFGVDPPSNDASVHDLSLNSYNYQVDYVGVEVFTAKWLKGKSTINVSVQDFKLTNGNADPTGYLYVNVCTGGPSTCTSKKITVNQYGTGSTSFSGLSTTTKYFVRFVVPNNGDKRTFYGTIS